MVVTERRDAIWILRLAAEATRNALDLQMAQALSAAVDGALADDRCSVLIITANGRTFSIGPDLAGLLKLARSPDGVDRLAAVISRYNDILLSLYGAKKLSIAAINGPALGGGFSITLPCDYRISVDRATFGERFFHMGLTPDLGASFFLPRLMGTAAAENLIWSGRLIQAQEAQHLGLIHEVVPTRDVLLDRAQALAVKLAEGALEVVAESRALLRRQSADDLQHHLALERDAMLRAFARRDIVVPRLERLVNARG